MLLTLSHFEEKSFESIHFLSCTAYADKFNCYAVLLMTLDGSCRHRFVRKAVSTNGLVIISIQWWNIAHTHTQTQWCAACRGVSETHVNQKQSSNNEHYLDYSRWQVEQVKQTFTDPSELYYSIGRQFSYSALEDEHTHTRINRLMIMMDGSGQWAWSATSGTLDDDEQQSAMGHLVCSTCECARPVLTSSHRVQFILIWARSLRLRMQLAIELAHT